MNPDYPAQEKEQDLLQRYRFAEEIAKGIVNTQYNTNESIVFGINGAWGSGKSSILNFLKKEIDKQSIESNKAHFIYNFNPWMFSNQEQLQSSFFSELSKFFYDASKRKKEGRFKYINKITSFVTKVNEANPELLSKTAIKTLGGILSKYAEKNSSEKSVLALKEEVNSILIKSKIRLYIFLDDLDRLTPSEISQIFQLIKLNANFNNTIFIIAYDKSVVIQALRKEYEENAEKYMDKIIQVDYTVPGVLMERIEEIFYEKLKEFFIEFGLQYDDQIISYMWKKGLRHYFKTLRDVYRYINSLRFRLPIIADEVVIPHYLAVEAIRIFDYNSYELLYINYSDLKAEPKILNEYHSSVGTEDLIKFLFHKSIYANYLQVDKEKAFYNSGSFERYFALKISSKDISETELHEFIMETTPEGKDAILKKIHGDGRINSLVRRLGDQNLKNKYALNSSSFFRSLLNIRNLKEEEFNDCKEELWIALINIASSFQEKSGYQLLIDEIITGSHQYNFVKLFYASVILERNSNFVRIDSDIIALFSINEEKLSSVYKKELENWASTIMTHNHEKKFTFRYFLDRIATIHPETYKMHLKTIQDDVRMLMSFLKLFIDIDSQSKLPFQINLKSKDILLPGDLYNIFIAKLRSIPLIALSEEDRRYLEYFLVFLKSSEYDKLFMVK
jgi:hypothetical protein